MGHEGDLITVTQRCSEKAVKVTFASLKNLMENSASDVQIDEFLQQTRELLFERTDGLRDYVEWIRRKFPEVGIDGELLLKYSSRINSEVFIAHFKTELSNALESQS